MSTTTLSPTVPDAGPRVSNAEKDKGRQSGRGGVADRNNSGQRPSPRPNSLMSRKDTRDVARHLTVSQCCDVNPLVSRFIEFGNSILKACESSESTDEMILTISKAFYYTEKLKKSTSVEKKKKQQAVLPKKGEKKEESGDKRKEVAETASRFYNIFPTYAVPKVLGQGADRKTTVFNDQSARDRVLSSEATNTLDVITSRTRRVIRNMLNKQSEDQKILNSDEFKTHSQELMKFHNIDGDREGAYEYARQLFIGTDLEGRGSIISVKQHSFLKKENLLLDKTQILAAIRAISVIAQYLPEEPVDFWDKSQLKQLRQDNDVTNEIVKDSMNIPSWKGAINLGSIHPRVLALQARELQDSEVSKALNELLIKGEYLNPFYAPILQRQIEPDALR